MSINAGLLGTNATIVTHSTKWQQ